MDSDSSSDSELVSSSSSDDFNQFLEDVQDCQESIQPYQFEPQLSSDDDRSIRSSDSDEVPAEQEDRLHNSDWWVFICALL